MESWVTLQEVSCFWSFLGFLKLFSLMYIVFSALLPSSPLLPSPMIPLLPNSSEDSVFFYFPCRLDPYMSVLDSSLLSRFSGVENCRLVFFALGLKATYEWGHCIFVFLGLGYLTQYDVFLIREFACNFQMSLFFSAVWYSICKCSTFSSSILWSGSV